MGAKHVVVTQEENLSARLNEITQSKGARVVFDPVGGKTVLDLADGMAVGGILFQYGALSSDPTPFPLMAALSKSLTMRGYVVFEIVRDPIRCEKAKQFILKAMTAGTLKPIIAKTFPLEKIVQAHRYLESNAQIGKIVVTV